MLSTAAELSALQRVADLETPLAAVEDRLAALGAALVQNNAQAIETEATELHRALAAAIQHFSRAAREGVVPPPLRQRLALASGQVAAQREALARATAALDRAIDVLLPGMGGSVYIASGSTDRSGHSGGLLA
jgi:uncharacterized coiled-coil protein SlyX